MGGKRPSLPSISHPRLLPHRGPTRRPRGRGTGRGRTRTRPARSGLAAEAAARPAAQGRGRAGTSARASSRTGPAVGAAPQGGPAGRRGGRRSRSRARPPSRAADTGGGARARAGGAPPVPERRGQEARAGAGARQASRVPFAPTAARPAEGIGRAAPLRPSVVIRRRRSRLSRPVAARARRNPQPRPIIEEILSDRCKPHGGPGGGRHEGNHRSLARRARPAGARRPARPGRPRPGRGPGPAPRELAQLPRLRRRDRRRYRPPTGASRCPTVPAWWRRSERA